VSQRIQIKRSTASATPGVSSLLPGELAYSKASDKLFIGDPGGTSTGASVILIGGGFNVSVVNAIISGGGGIWDTGTGIFNASQVASAVSTVDAPADLLDSLTQMSSAIDTALNISGSSFVEKAGDIMTGSLRMSGSAFVLAEEGSATLPGFAFDADRDTGMFQAESDVLAFAAGASTMLRLDNASSVTVLAPLHATTGASATPGISFAGDADTGLLLQGTNAFDVITGATTVVRFIGSQLQAVNGLNGAPSYSFIADVDAGMFLVGVGVLGFAVDGSTMLQIDAGSSITALAQFQATSGTVSAPGVAFSADINTGMYLNADGTLAFAAAGASVLNASAAAVEVKTAQLLHGDGTAALPVVAFESEPTTGIYQPSAGHWAVTILGTNVMTVSATGVSLSSQFSTPAGTAGAPGFAFNADGDTGMFLAGEGILAFSASGDQVIRASSAAVVFEASQLLAQRGSALAPAYSFESDPNQGMYRNVATGATTFSDSSGLDRLAITSTQLRASTLVQHNNAGSVTSPAYSFSGTTNTGMYSPNIGLLGFTAAGASVITASTAAVEIKAAQVLVQDGAATAPGVGFESDPDTGVYLSATGRMGLAAAGSTIVNVTEDALSNRSMVEAPAAKARTSDSA